MLGRLFLVTALLLGSAEAAYRHTKELRLKKDETAKLLVKEDDTSRLLQFRWTLYQNGGLVLHRSYNGFNAQNLLRMNHKNRSVRVPIDMRGPDPRAFTYIVLKFKTFDAARGEAVFELLLRDDAERVELRYLEETDE